MAKPFGAASNTSLTGIAIRKDSSLVHYRVYTECVFRLAGAALLAPVVNFWWTGFPANLSSEAFHQQLKQDQWIQRVVHHAPWLTYWWSTQKLFPASSVIGKKRDKMNTQDLELIPKVTPLMQPYQVRLIRYVYRNQVRC